MSQSRLSSRASIAIATATLCCVALTAVSPAAAKSKPKCKRGQVAVTVNKKPGCRAAKSLLPRAKVGDQLRASLQAALAFQPARRAGKKLKTISSVLGRRRAAAVRRKLLKALPTLVARLQGTKPGRAAALLDPCSDKAPDFESTKSGVDLGVSKGQATLSSDVGGRLSVVVSFPGDSVCNHFKAPACPTAAGAVDGSDQRQPEFRVQIFEGTKLLVYEAFRDKGKTKLQGQVGADAKLSELVISDTLTHVVRLGGSAFGVAYTEDGTVRRTLRVDMKTGAQTTGDVSAKVESRLDGKSSGAAYDEGAGYLLLVKSGPEFVALVDKAVRRYRDLETGWNADKACASIDWAPASGALKLHKSDHGRVTSTISAKAGGTAADGVTAIAAQANGTFAPREARGGSPAFDYTVTASSGQLTLSVRATSTAGVASAAWTQPIGNADWPVQQITGTFSGRDENNGFVRSWSGSASWKRAPNLDQGNTFRALSLVAGSYTATLSGTTVDGCTISGQKHFTMNPSPTIPSFKVLNPAADVVFGAGKVDWQLPWDYFWSTTLTTETKMDITLSSCPDPMEDGTITDGAGAPKPTGELPGTTADGFAFSGSYPSPSGSETWSLTGTPTS
jgi:hypothetical protein